MINIAYISLGSNIEDRAQHLQDACSFLNQDIKINVLASSSIYETDPVGYTDQGKFLNIVLKVETDLTAEQLLEKCLNIEQELGRIREFRWGPRTIDLDILLFNNENIETERLIVPHPRMHERAFVLVPLIEIDPTIQLPNATTPLHQILDEIPDKEGVRLWR
ncbi:MULTISPECIES: 2-amino-4-hydroxy-6-hydroxymethyldihydropteridine diphosphokinase [Heyndrickxia]|jgi:2-amino-4-hydroxy-6-hydroxymethyldihydropteridine diphosphokinase|uniref:2-amino-4-hydroxy-6- hydroxymethyldihydropteridine diphosphokinase n=1 Tax=Heyndrickxia TaxID=2837504 RepID=UPI00039DC6B5|nr:2-amino-4-hydroxy-6-hydroxymethyldihydropteridine diphosphokinase [Heyndrickxia oleronia]NYV68861.1 2-amino-4-hydroxy-6-hydroxymethyldihydropteridine diphosphokinase [Bacillus sp. Gen3]OJH16967.1 2-amino-4-hydroxy-6-hydroxymethyldihydropteridine diphosphokinase [Bacillus obstructivus]MBU5214798.1 2-amino-4-hydroxy-6-hydroxymethyldihydropteridine diphosphokinase [Heyndrickxia oleronia]MCI1591536.1 2-amino-4-hydroxy-6-hydroxymethyldihydropteridine diphosphokinase [Heyndrickxia oleronia]MCI161